MKGTNCGKFSCFSRFFFIFITPYLCFCVLIVFCPCVIAVLSMCGTAPLPETKCRRPYVLHTLLLMSLHTTMVYWYRHTRATRFMHPHAYTRTLNARNQVSTAIFFPNITGNVFIYDDSLLDFGHTGSCGYCGTYYLLLIALVVNVLKIKFGINCVQRCILR